MSAPVVRAKFKCWSIQRNQNQDPSDQTARVQLMAAYANGDPDNASWSKATPSATLDMFITNPDAIEKFEEGRFYYLDFIPCD
ncbi:hypothetical protein [Agrobacterium rosae]|uniref:hypothetical protein n=1 Tax=Agrobacterium rosae TaxID=1972867 RepID=UPI003BA024D6